MTCDYNYPSSFRTEVTIDKPLRPCVSAFAIRLQPKSYQLQTAPLNPPLSLPCYTRYGNLYQQFSHAIPSVLLSYLYFISALLDNNNGPHPDPARPQHHHRVLPRLTSLPVPIPFPAQRSRIIPPTVSQCLARCFPHVRPASSA